MRTALDYLRRHAIAILALICSLLALAGASYATLRLPAGSVGARAAARQLDHSRQVQPQAHQRGGPRVGDRRRERASDRRRRQAGRRR